MGFYNFNQIQRRGGQFHGVYVTLMVTSLDRHLDGSSQGIQVIRLGTFCVRGRAGRIYRQDQITSRYEIADPIKGAETGAFVSTGAVDPITHTY